MKRIGIAIIAACFITGLAVAGAGARMAGGKGMAPGMGMGMGGGAAWECGMAPMPCTLSVHWALMRISRRKSSQF